MATRDEWATAFASQARSDWAVFRLLEAKGNELPQCQRLHYVQMACEKIAKAYRIRDLKELKIDDAMRSHKAFEPFISSFLASETITNEYREKNAQLDSVRKSARQIAGEVENLAPAVDPVGAPANTEYPWEDGGRVYIPCAHAFPTFRPENRHWASFVKLVERALKDFESIHIR